MVKIWSAGGKETPDLRRLAEGGDSVCGHTSSRNRSGGDPLPVGRNGAKMFKRTTPDPGVLCDDRRLTAEYRRGPSMTVQHSHDAVVATIFIIGADSPTPAHMACFGRLSGEAPEDTEARWNRMAEQLWRMGLEPPEDEPFFTAVEDGAIWDHYALVPIMDYSYDERPLHV